MSDSIANRDEAMKCLVIAKRALIAGDIAKAQKFGQKASKLYNCREVENFLAEISGDRPSHQSSHTHTHGHQGTAASHAKDRPSASGVRHRGTHNAPDEPSSSTPEREKKVTPEQKQIVQQVLKARDFYEILGVDKRATDEDIKKAYRKLALKLHPDKNEADKAEEAFKRVSKAFSCLSDPDKRAYYERTGYENASAAQAAQAGQRSAGQGNVYYAEDFDPEEIFNMFFGGNLHPRSHMFRQHFSGRPRQPQSPEQQQRNLMFGLLQFLPVIILFVFTFFTGSQEPVFSLTRDYKYTAMHTTTRLKTPFYVKSAADFEKNYAAGSRSRVRLEKQVESEYYERVQSRCHQEKLTQQRLWTWGHRDKAREMAMPSCSELQGLNEKLGLHRYSDSSYVYG